MFKIIIENYINNMNINDLIMFSNKENIFLEDDEYIKIFEKIKKDWQELLKNEDKVKRYLDDNFDCEKRNEIFNLYLKYQKKYSSYL